jgi:exosortase/archaeosortase family protein
VPTVVESYSVTIPEGRFTIAEGCSGKRYLIVALAFAALVAAMRGLRARRAALLVAASAALALIANWLRVIVIIYAGHVSNMQHYLVAEEHITFGWLLFAPLLLGIVMVARLLDRGSKPAPATAANGATDGCATAGRAAWVLSALCLAIPALAVATRPEGTSGTARLGQLPLMRGRFPRIRGGSPTMFRRRTSGVPLMSRRRETCRSM